MSRDTIQILLVLSFAAAILCIDAWASYGLGVKRQERLQAWLSAGQYQKRKRLRWGLYICGALSLTIAFGGYWIKVPALIVIGLYAFLCIVVHRLAYAVGKKAATDPDR